MDLFNNRFLRERGMASNLKMEYQVFHCIFQKNSTMAKGRIKSEDTGEFSRLKKIFQISLLSYYIQYMTMIKYLCNLLYCKFKNTIIIRLN